MALRRLAASSRLTGPMTARIRSRVQARPRRMTDGCTPAATPTRRPEDSRPTTVRGSLIQGRRRPGVDAARPSRRGQPGQSGRDPLAAARGLPGRPYRRSPTAGGSPRPGPRPSALVDPYNQNTLKGDRPICDPADESEARRRSLGCRAHRLLGLTGPDWFFVASAISDTVIEPRTFPIPVGVQTTQRPGSIDVFGDNRSLVLVADLHRRPSR